jgi:two-component system phosphate regulon sensor histidine kinase PhoR
MKSQLVRQLVVTAIVLVVLALASIEFILGYYERQQQSAVQAHLQQAAALLAAMPRQEALKWASLAENDVQFIGAGSEMLAQSNPALPGDRVADDPEVRSALQGQKGESVRRVGRELRCFLAVPLSASTYEAARVLRISAPVGISAAGLTSIRFQVPGLALLSATVALAIAYLVALRLTRRISRLKSFAEALLDSPEPDTGIGDANDEIGSLERALNGVAGQLRELLERWRVASIRSEAILSSMAEGVLAVDREMRVVFCNQAVLRAIAINRPVPERTPLLEIVRDSELNAILTRVVNSGDTVKQSLKVSAANDRVFEIQAAPFSTSGGQGALAILYDMTDIERLEQVRKDFVANVSHEMRTPLTSILGFSETLLDGGLEDLGNNRRFVEIIRSHAIRLNNIASDLLVLSELESGQEPSEPELIKIGELLESGVATIETEARSQGIRILRGQIEDARVVGHRFRLEQAVLNLLVNAVKFNREGGEVRVEARLDADRLIHISVSDTGVGIPSQDLPRIFERFYRVDKARSRQVGGTGLGLSIVRHVVGRMDGRVTVESQLGKGSTFTIILPTC